ncbi:MAG: hypothetical protein ACI8X5_004227 [Planctomycetota bacterium]|jgi:hypothetical protein
MQRIAFVAALIGSSLIATSATAQVSGSVQYEIRFDATWTSATHPGAFPGGAHFSPLIGATHDGSTHLWELGGIATQGIEVMAETGGTGSLTNEINTAIGLGTADQVVSGGGIGFLPGQISETITVNSSHPYLSLVTMIAPSPDWFLGVDAVPLLENGIWADTLVFDLYALDAGTDTGGGFNSSNQNTNPQTPIEILTGGPFFGTTALGTITVTLTSGATYCDAKMNSQGCLPSISSTGSASATSSSPFMVSATNVLNNKSGLLFYGLADNAAVFQGGTLCVGSPFVRTTIQNSGGSASGSDCTGSYAIDMNAWIQAGSDANLIVGQTVYTQYWSRDPQSPSGTGLTNGLEFVIQP